MAAYEALLRVEKTNAYSNIELNKVTQGKVHNPGFVRELTYGVIKNRVLLDFYIDKLAANGISSVKRELKVILRIGIYQILYMDSVPEHSAVDETVKLASEVTKGKTGFVNGVLRSFLRRYKAEKDPLDEPSDLDIKYSCEEGLVKLLVSQYGEEKAEEILSTSLETPPLFIRVNTLKTSVSKLSWELGVKGFKVNDTNDTVNLPEGTLEVSGKGILETDEFRNGEFFVQDASSTKAIEEFSPEPGETFIDVCAAPGGKTFAAALKMNDTGRILSIDLHENKLRALKKQADRLGISIIETRQHDAKETDESLWDTADKVLCDVPCSGLGVLRRKPEIKDRPLKNDGRDIAEIQLKILEASSLYVKPSGTLMYSTCTVNKIENEEVVRRFISENSGFEILKEEQLLPASGGADGFYYCILKRVETRRGDN